MFSIRNFSSFLLVWDRLLWLSDWWQRLFWVNFTFYLLFILPTMWSISEHLFLILSWLQKIANYVFSPRHFLLQMWLIFLHWDHFLFLSTICRHLLKNCCQFAWSSWWCCWKTYCLRWNMQEWYLLLLCSKFEWCF